MKWRKGEPGGNGDKQGRRQQARNVGQSAEGRDGKETKDIESPGGSEQELGYGILRGEDLR